MNADRPHPATVTSNRLLYAYEHWFDLLSASERDAIGVVRNALQRIAEPTVQYLAPCGTTAAYRRHLRHSEEPDQACRNAAAQEMRDYRAAAARNGG